MLVSNRVEDDLKRNEIDCCLRLKMKMKLVKNIGESKKLYLRVVCKNDVYFLIWVFVMIVVLEVFVFE